MIDFLISYDRNTHEFSFIKKPHSLIEVKTINGSIKFWGDPIGHEKINICDSIHEKEILERIGGHFYYLIVNKKKNSYSIGNSVFGMLPLYYSTGNGLTYFSGSSLAIADKTGCKNISRRFVLENILFNYQLFNHSCFDGINLLPVNSCVKLEKNKTEIRELICIENYFVSNPMPVKKSLSKISDLFIERVKYYLPDELYVCALTGGFDSRSLAAASVYYKKKFTVYSFGNDKAADVSIPRKLAGKAGKDYLHVLLEKKYVKSESFKNGKNFILNSEGNAGFSRAHYLYAASQLEKEFKYVITGNFGSEIFRSAHVCGVVTSKNLYNLFSAASYDEAIKKLNASEEWSALSKSEFKKEWTELKSDLKKLPCFNEKHKSLTKNQQFYIFMFNEIFRKYFGAEVVNQFKSVINRTPFLDFNFVKEVLKTEIAGVYSDFFTDNPVKRFKGQLIYSHIIKKIFPPFGRIKTDKGYKPDDLLTLIGKFSITASFLRKKSRKGDYRDEYCVDAAFENNRSVFKNEIKPHSFFNMEFINEGLNKRYGNRDAFFIALSQIWWINYLQKNHAAKS